MSTPSDPKRDQNQDLGLPEAHSESVEPTRQNAVTLDSIGRWGRFPTFEAKIGSTSSCCVLVRRARAFYVDQGIDYCDEQDLQGMSKSCTPTWQRGHIWKIEANRLFINKG